MSLKTDLQVLAVFPLRPRPCPWWIASAGRASSAGEGTLGFGFMVSGFALWAHESADSRFCFGIQSR